MYNYKKEVPKVSKAQENLVVAFILNVYLADSGFFKNFLYQGGVKSSVSWVFEDLKFKISEGYTGPKLVFS